MKRLVKRVKSINSKYKKYGINTETDCSSCKNETEESLQTKLELLNFEKNLDIGNLLYNNKFKKDSEERLEKSKKFPLTTKVDSFFIWLLNPFGFGFYTNLIILAIIYHFVDHEVLYWSNERYMLDFKAIFYGYIVLPITGVLLHYCAKIIDKFNNKYI